MALNVDRYAEKQAKLRSKDGAFWRLQDGKNSFRVFTFDHVVTARDFATGYYVKGAPNSPKIGEKVTEIDREQWRHFTGDEVKNCTRKPECPWCLEADELISSGNKADIKMGDNLKARRAFYLNAVDLSAPEEMKILQVPTSVYNDVITYITSGEHDADEIFGCEGRDFVVTRDSKADPANMYKVLLRDAKKSKPLDAELAESVTDLLDFKMLDAGASGSDDEEEEVTSKSSKKATSTKAKAKTKAKVEEPEDDDEGEEEEEAEEEKPAKATKKATTTKAPAKAAKTSTAKAKAKKEEEEEEEEEFEDDGEEAEEEESEEHEQNVPTGSQVTFEDDDNTVTGEVIGFDAAEGIYDVRDESGGDWQMGEDDFTVVPKKASKKKVSKK